MWKLCGRGGEGERFYSTAGDKKVLADELILVFFLYLYLYCIGIVAHKKRYDIFIYAIQRLLYCDVLN